MDQSGKIRLEEHVLKISKIAKFESDTSLASEDIHVAPQSLEISQMFVWWGHKLDPHLTKVCKFYNFEAGISSLVVNKSCTNLAILLILRCCFEWC